MKELAKAQSGDFIFAGQARNRPLSNMAMDMMLRRMKREDVTVMASAPASAIGRAMFPVSRAR